MNFLLKKLLINDNLITEPDFSLIDALAPFQPLAMKAVHYPIDTSLNFAQANKLIRDLKPENLVVPESYTKPPPITVPLRLDLVIEPVPVKRLKNIYFNLINDILVIKLKLFAG